MDQMTVVGKDGRIRYIIEGDEVTDVLNCKHEFPNDGPCIHCNLYADELIKKENN